MAPDSFTLGGRTVRPGPATIARRAYIRPLLVDAGIAGFVERFGDLPPDDQATTSLVNHYVADALIAAERAGIHGKILAAFLEELDENGKPVRWDRDWANGFAAWIDTLSGEVDLFAVPALLEGAIRGFFSNASVGSGTFPTASPTPVTPDPSTPPTTTSPSTTSGANSSPASPATTPP